MKQILKNKIALITGGGSGIGLATARRFIHEGAQVIITGRRSSELDKVVTDLGKAAYAVVCDVRDNESMAKVFADIQKRYGRLDIVFANAGIVEIQSISRITLAQYDDVFDTCVKGSLFTVQMAIPLMKNGGSIILNSAAIADKGIEGLGLNAAAKSAVRSLGRTMAVELAADNIRVNTVSAGTINTPLIQKSGMSSETVTMLNSDVSPIPLKRIGRPDELAASVLFLASDESSYITGTDLLVDGGANQL